MREVQDRCIFYDRLKKNVQVFFTAGGPDVEALSVYEQQIEGVQHHNLHFTLVNAPINRTSRLLSVLYTTGRAAATERIERSLPADFFSSATENHFRHFFRTNDVCKSANERFKCYNKYTRGV